MNSQRLVFGILHETLLGVILLGIVCASPMTSTAQTPAPVQSQTTSPTFDVAVIRPMNDADTTPAHISNSPHSGDIKAVNVNLKALLEVAYDLPDTRMFGGPDWITTEKFNLEARSDPTVSEQISALPTDRAKQAKRLMLQTLLADRFKLTVHDETREMPIYALVVAKDGPKLVKYVANVKSAANIKSGTNTETLSGGRAQITIQGAEDTLAILTYELSWRLGRLVVDQTGLEGRYKLTLKWADDDAAPSGSDPDPSLFTAIQEQLGLKLEPTKGPVPVLIIDHAEKPSAN
jgi:uncharacterized protein (TIGR03435 family)